MSEPPSRDVIKARLREFIRTELIGSPSYPLEDDEPLITGGLIDSFSLALLGVFIEERFGVFVPDTDLNPEEIDTLNQIVERVVLASSG